MREILLKTYNTVIPYSILETVYSILILSIINFRYPRTKKMSWNMNGSRVCFTLLLLLKHIVTLHLKMWKESIIPHSLLTAL